MLKKLALCIVRSKSCELWRS